MKNDVKALFSAALFLTLMFGAVSINLLPLFSGQGGPDVRPFAGWTSGVENPEDPRGVAQFMFGEYALPLEILSIVLFVALVAAILLAKPDHPET